MYTWKGLLFGVLCILWQGSSAGNKFKVPTRFSDYQGNIWLEYDDLLEKYDPVDLASGNPDFPPLKPFREALSQVGRSSDYHFHQYARIKGDQRFVEAVSKVYSKLIGHQIDPMNEVLPTVGATGALATAIYGHVEVGDEVIIIEPYFYSYIPMIKSAGGIPKFIPLRLEDNSKNKTIRAEEWILDKNELESAFNNKTKAIILNNPHNPLGKVFTMEELQHIADLCKKWNVLVIADEVYEFYVFKPYKHIRFASLPGMWNRTITIGSAGKTFIFPGWRLGWALGPKHLIYNLQVVHPNFVDSGITPIQEAVARIFEQVEENESYFDFAGSEIKEKIDYVVKIMSGAGMRPIIPQAGYFLTVDWTPLESRVDLKSEVGTYKDDRFTMWMLKKLGLLVMPSTPFYSEGNRCLGENYIRVSIIKVHKTLEKANMILQKWKNS